MKAARYIAAFVGVLLIEVFVTALFSFRAVNLAKYPYRLEQRVAAAEAYHGDRSPEKEAAYTKEMILAGRHNFRRQLVLAGSIFSAFLILNGIVIYRLKQHHETQTLP